MVKLLGAALVAGGCAWLGFRRALELKDRVRALEQMSGGLALVERELALGAPPLPRRLEGGAGRRRRGEPARRGGRSGRKGGPGPAGAPPL